MILTLDLETTNYKSLKRIANQFDSANSIVCIGYQHDNEPTQCEYFYRHEPIFFSYNKILQLDKTKLIVGQNLKFDLLWLWDYEPFQEWLINGGMLWDTLTAEHLIRGGEQIGHVSIPGGDRALPKDLDSLAKRYGAELKDAKVKEFLSKGCNPAEYEDIDELMDYCKGDVANTYHIFKAQYQLAKQLGLLKVIKIYMQHYAAVCDMEFNGIYIDKEKMEIQREALLREVEAKGDEVKALAKDIFPEGFQFNPASPRHISLALFGGKFDIMKPTLQFDPASGLPILVKSKSSKDYGRQKTKLVKYEHNIEGQFESKGLPKDAFGYTKTDEKILKNLAQNELITKMLEYRELNKRLGTYYYKDSPTGRTGLMTCINPKDGCIHPNFKTGFTVTSRLACSDPNVQNLPSAIHSLIISKFPNGKIFSVDFSSMEVFITAIRSQCPVLIADLKRQGFDMHRNSASFTFKSRPEEVTKEQRTLAKRQTFQLLYGAHYKTMAKFLRLPEEICKAFVAGFYDRYYGVKQWHDSLEYELYEQAQPTEELLPISEWVKDGEEEKRIWYTRPYEYRHKSYLTNQFGQRWCFKDIGYMTNSGFPRRRWPSTDIKNYTVQGTASLFVNLGVSLLWKELAKLKNYTRLINEIHDEVWIDVAESHVDEVKRILHHTMGQVTNHMNRIFNIDLGLDIGIEIGIGNNIAEAKAK